MLQASTTSIYQVISELITMKTTHDGASFTNAQLANAIDVPRSSICRLLHPDTTKRVTNPTVEMLLKIVHFFREDGFDVTMDHLLGFRQSPICRI